MSTDSEIIRMSLDDPRAFAAIFERHAADVGAYAGRRVGASAAEDVVSDTFLVAFRKRARFDHAWSSARPWLLGIATRNIRRHHAAEAKRLREWDAVADRWAAEQRRAPHDAEAADARLDASEDLHALLPAIASLAPDDRDTLVLFAIGDLSYEEIASALGVPVGTVKSRMNRVRRALERADGRAQTDSTSRRHGAVATKEH